MKKMLLLYALLMAVLLQGCGTLRQWALSNAVGPALGEASNEIERESNWELFRQGVPGNIKMIEGLLFLSPHNQDLLLQALKAHGAYAFGVWETLWLQEADRKAKARHHQLALQHYSKAIHWGLSFFRERDLTSAQLQRAQREGTLTELLDSSIADPQGLEATFFLAQSMGGYGNLQRTSPMVLAQLPLVKALFDWACTRNPTFRNGSCAIFYGAWETGRPKMLGGDLAKGKQLFLSAMEQFPQNYLIRLSYLRFYVIPTKDRKAYQRESAFLRQAFGTWRERFHWPPHRPEPFQDNLNLYNAIAQKQFAALMENRYEKTF